MKTKIDYWDCSINAVIENKDNKLLTYPKINSIVTIGIYPTNNQAVILSVSEVDKIYFRNEKRSSRLMLQVSNSIGMVRI